MKLQLSTTSSVTPGRSRAAGSSQNHSKRASNSPIVSCSSWFSRIQLDHVSNAIDEPGKREPIAAKTDRTAGSGR
jgi:hypothetical protein